MLPTIRNRFNRPSLGDSLFGRDFLDNFFEGFGEKSGLSIPAVNLAEAKDEYRIEVAAPGLEKKDFKIGFDNGVLTVSSEKETKNEDKDELFMRQEFNYSKFNRSFMLPEGVDADNIKAEHKEGVLNIHIPKKEEIKQKAPKQIEIK